jgi:hypothetical protein
MRSMTWIDDLVSFPVTDLGTHSVGPILYDEIWGDNQKRKTRHESESVKRSHPGCFRYTTADVGVLL